MTLHDLQNLYTKARLIEEAVSREKVPTIEFRFDHGRYPEDAPSVAKNISDIEYSVTRNVFTFILVE